MPYIKQLKPCNGLIFVTPDKNLFVVRGLQACANVFLAYIFAITEERRSAKIMTKSLNNFLNIKWRNNQREIYFPLLSCLRHENLQ
jgi:hypothetical protein